MHFGLHYLLSCADSQTPYQRYRDTVEQAVHAERLGFESVWPVEQHFNARASVMPCPTLMLAAIAERTRTLRLGTAIVQLPLWHPLRVAEELATLDVLSGGRVECGVGRGSNPVHFEGFGASLAESRERFVEALDVLRRAWTEPSCSFKGRYYTIDAVALAPKPYQQPHPPLRVAANSVETAAWAGSAGYPIIIATNVNPLPKAKNVLAAYTAARAEAGLPVASRDDVTLLVPTYVAQDADQARAEFEPSVQQYARLLVEVGEATLSRLKTEAERSELSKILDRVRGLSYRQVQEVIGIVGSTEACLERLESIDADFKPGRIITWFNFGGLVAHEHVLRSMECFAAQIMPRFASR